jgi:hypothetical protein
VGLNTLISPLSLLIEIGCAVPAKTSSRLRTGKRTLPAISTSGYSVLRIVFYLKRRHRFILDSSDVSTTLGASCDRQRARRSSEIACRQRETIGHDAGTMHGNVAWVLEVSTVPCQCHC